MWVAKPGLRVEIISRLWRRYTEVCRGRNKIFRHGGAVPEALIELLALLDEITGVLPVPQVGIYDNSCHAKTGQ